MQHSITVIVGTQPGAMRVAQTARTALESAFPNHESNVGLTTINGISTFRILVDDENVKEAS